MTRHVFYSFEYKSDNWRASQIRNIGNVDGNKPAHDNDWEAICRGGDSAIERWIKEQMKGRTCTLVLIGATTAGRKWIDYEITESWKAGMGVAGIHIYQLLDRYKKPTNKGSNPFSKFNLASKPFDQIVRSYDPSGDNSKDVYAWISDNISAIIEEAIQIRGRY